jgi:cytochrome b subunit of formate dehydrogenase
MWRFAGFLLLLAAIFAFSVCYAKEVPFTLEDRDRLIRLEEGQKALNQRIDEQSKRIDDLKDLIYIVIGAIIAQTIGVVGFVIWDRRTAITPVTKITKEIEEKEERVEKILREYARREPRLAEILKEVGGL